MCGIAGIWSKEQRYIPEHQIKKMTNAMSHRGPDAEGFYSVQGLALGHRDEYEKISSRENPYGDGTASRKIVSILNSELNNE